MMKVFVANQNLLFFSERKSTNINKDQKNEIKTYLKKQTLKSPLHSLLHLVSSGMKGPLKN